MELVLLAASEAWDLLVAVSRSLFILVAAGVKINFPFVAMGSHRSTPQRRDSFSDVGKHPSYGGPMSHFYSTFGMSPAGSGMGIGAISPSPGPLSGMIGSAHSHHSMSPPPLSSPSGFFGELKSRYRAVPEISGDDNKLRPL